MEPFVYKTIKQDVSHEIDKIKGSRFIGQLFFVENKGEIENHLTACRKQFPTANHHCSAWTLGVQDTYQSHASDDGEPSGTAGKPILFVLEGKQLHNVFCVISRIFGGTKLGKGGLVQAYTEAAQAVVAQAEILEIPVEEELSISYSYDDVASVRYLCDTHHASILTEDYGDLITAKLMINVACTTAFKHQLTEKNIATIVSK